MGRLFIIVVCALLMAARPAAARSEADLKAQLQLLMKWWPGSYDNNEQIVRQSGGGLAQATSKPFYRLHSVFKPVAVPSLGEHVLYLEEYQTNDPQDIARIRLYSVAVDLAENALRVKFHSPHDSKALVGAWRDLSRVEQLTAADVRTFSDQCNVYLRFVGGQFQGGMKKESCTINDGREWFDYELVVGPSYYWARDRRLAANTGQVTWEMAPGSNYEWFEQTKARWFTCTVNHNPDGDMTRTEYLTTVELHDQGGEADIPWPDGRTLTFVIHTRAFTSPSQRVFPLFRIHDKRNMTVPIAYAYAVDDADRFGLNLGWYYTLCRLRDAGAPRADPQSQ